MSRTNQTSTSRGFFHFFGGKRLSFAPTLEHVFGSIAGGKSTGAIEDLLLQRAANDAAQR